MQRLNKLSFFMIALAGVVMLNSCDKNKVYKTTNPLAQVHFNNTVGATSDVVQYFITNSPTSTFTVSVGTTDVSDQDRTVTYKLTSPTGAVAGTHYTIQSPGSTTLTIPAGQTTANIVVHGIFAPYSAGTRKDTLVFTLDNPSTIEHASFSDTLKLVLQRYCDVNLAVFTGPYIAQDYYQGSPDGGPYPVTLSNATSTGATTATVRLNGLWGISNPITINLDWADPANFTTFVPTQPWFVHGTYGQVTTRPNGLGTFSSCDNTFQIGYENTVSIGTFGKYITTLRK